MNDADTAFHLRLGWETFASLAGDFEVGFFPIMCVVCHKVSVVEGCDSSTAALAAMKNRWTREGAPLSLGVYHFTGWIFLFGQNGDNQSGDVSGSIHLAAL